VAGAVITGRDSDTGLVAALAAGDLRALERLYGRYGPVVWSLARAVCGDPAVACDVTRAVFVDLWDAPHCGRVDDALGVWLVARAHAEAMDRVRRHDSPRLSVEACDIRAGRAFATLTADEREVLALTYFGGHTAHEVAALLGRPVAAIKASAGSGLRHLGARAAG
jgi:RNA polymerase sigma-70 factor (ECF subfamily)